MELQAWAQELVMRVHEADLSFHSLAVGDKTGSLIEKYWWPYRPELPQSTHSITKSFTSMAVGLAIDEGFLSLDTTVADILGQHSALDPKLAQATIEDLLTMRSGHRHMLGGNQLRRNHISWVDAYLALEVAQMPGREFLYSSGTSHLLSALVQKVTGLSVATILEQRLFQPLNYQAHSWEHDPQGISSGGNGLSLRLCDLWKWGLVCLQGGMWEGRQILPQDWLSQATRPVVRFGIGEQESGAIGYGYHIWCGQRGIYYASGIFGQNCLIVPDLGWVIAFTAGLADEEHHRLLALVMSLLPTVSSPPQNNITREPVQAMAYSGAPPALSVKTAELMPLIGLWQCGSNPMGWQQIGLEVSDTTFNVILHESGRSHTIRCGLRSWQQGETGMPFWYLHHAYQPERTTLLAAVRQERQRGQQRQIQLDWYFPETPFRDKILLQLGDADTLQWRHETNVNSGELHYHMNLTRSIE